LAQPEVCLAMGKGVYGQGRIVDSGRGYDPPRYQRGQTVYAGRTGSLAPSLGQKPGADTSAQAGRKALRTRRSTAINYLSTRRSTAINYLSTPPGWMPREYYSARPLPIRVANLFTGIRHGSSGSAASWRINYGYLLEQTSTEWADTARHESLLPMGCSVCLEEASVRAVNIFNRLGLPQCACDHAGVGPVVLRYSFGTQTY
jgi:hypothetical protein